MIAKGMIRIKCVDLSNWAARENIFNTMDANSDVRFGTEGMDTVNVYVAKTDSIESLMSEFRTAFNLAIEKLGAMSDNLMQLMKSVKAILDTDPSVITQSFKMQLNEPGVSSYIEVVIKEVNV